jgi:phage terminase small subunit
MLKLNPRQQKFVVEYSQDFNATQAAIRAGYSKRTAKQIGSLLLTNKKVVQGIADFPRPTDITPGRILREYARVAFLDVADCHDEQGRLKSIQEMPIDARRAVTSLEQEETAEGNRLKKLRFASKIKALDSLARIHGMLADNSSDAGGPGFEVHIHLGSDNIRNVTPARNGTSSNGAPKLIEED